MDEITMDDLKELEREIEANYRQWMGAGEPPGTGWREEFARTMLGSVYMAADLSPEHLEFGWQMAGFLDAIGAESETVDCTALDGKVKITKS